MVDAAPAFHGRSRFSKKPPAPKDGDTKVPFSDLAGLNCENGEPYGDFDILFCGENIDVLYAVPAGTVVTPFGKIANVSCLGHMEFQMRLTGYGLRLNWVTRK